MEINTTLLREKFVIRDTEDEQQEPITAVSNRLSLPLHSPNGNLTDTLIIRAQNMHSCIRMTSTLLKSFMQAGPLFARSAPFDFNEAWRESISVQDKFHNKNLWCAVYHKGKEIFSFGTPPAFLSVIEKCDAKNPGNYDKSVQIAEETFKKMGRIISISYEANIGMVLNVKRDIGRCGLIHRSASKNSTFNMTVEPVNNQAISPVHCLDICANFLEGLQLAFCVGITNDKIKSGAIKKFSEQDHQNDLTIEYIKDLEYQTNSFNNLYQLRFRPEKPDFHEAIENAEIFFKKSKDSQSRQIQ